MSGPGPGPTVTPTPWATIRTAVRSTLGWPAAWAPWRFLCCVVFRVTWQRLWRSWSLSFICCAIDCLPSGGNVAGSYFSFNFLNMDVGGFPWFLTRFPARGRWTVAQWDHRDTFRSRDSWQSGDRCDFALLKLLTHRDHGGWFACFFLSRRSGKTPFSGWRQRSGSVPWFRPGVRMGPRPRSRERSPSRSRPASRSWVRQGPSLRSGSTGCVWLRVGSGISVWPRGSASPSVWRVVLTRRRTS